jgi:aminoglycoside phosphotransferase (APT) family kinase protein
MASPKMHADEVHTDVALVRRLLAAQFPEWQHLPVEPVPSAGTDNALYRLGDEFVARLPRHERTSGTLERERLWLPRLAPHLPLRIPEPEGEGLPGAGYPFTWSIYRWLEGGDATVASFADLRQAASDLAAFITALQGIEAAGAPSPDELNAFRGEPVEARDGVVRRWIASLDGVVDIAAVTEVWDTALAAPAWQGPPVLMHGDLDRRNLLVVDGRLGAVVDWGCFAAGDPACEVMVAWKVFRGESRDVFRDALDVDDATWTRSRGWAISQALGALSYYTDETNPGLRREAKCWLADVLRSG